MWMCLLLSPAVLDLASSEPTFGSVQRSVEPAFDRTLVCLLLLSLLAIRFLMSIIVVIVTVGYYYFIDSDCPFGGAFGTYVRPLRSVKDARPRRQGLPLV